MDGAGWIVKNQDGGQVARLTGFLELMETSSERLTRLCGDGFILLTQGEEESWEATLTPPEMDYAELSSALRDLY